MNARIFISLISDFLAKLMKLPLHFFDTKMVGSIMQRIGDHERIKNFLTGSSISTLFSFVSFFIFAIVLAYYDLTVLGIFLLGNGLYGLDTGFQSLPEGLRTNYSKQLPAAKELKGSADIILADRNVLERLLAPLRKVMSYEY